MKVVWTREAIRDLIEARDHVAADDPTAAARLASRIIRATEKLAQHPEIGRKGRLRGTRELVVSNTPYFIPYRIQSGRVELLRVYHGARLYPPRRS
ncbi:MAG: type II toxin-antitoxin system RelE/ParE family toxin [Pyrinomonadaceae bacterium]